MYFDKNYSFWIIANGAEAEALHLEADIRAALRN